MKKIIAALLVLTMVLALTGSAYGRERSNGFVASDFLFALTEDGLYMNVEDRYYAVQDGTLVLL